MKLKPIALSGGLLLRRGLLVTLVLAAPAALGAWFVVSSASLSALPEPGSLETYVATRGKRFLVGRRARDPLPHQPPQQPASAAIGGMQFRARCAVCHGLDGRAPSDVGRAMYPRASDLGSAAVQRWSDAELFWIIKNGLRLTGMPGFSKSLSDDEIWPLVYYIRSLAGQPSGKAVLRPLGPQPDTPGRFSGRQSGSSPSTLGASAIAGGMGRPR